MIAHGDIEVVNLRTGERQRRVVGNGESWLELLGIKGLEPLDPTELVEYERAMDEAIKDILQEVFKRSRFANDARNRGPLTDFNFIPVLR